MAETIRNPGFSGRLYDRFIKKYGRLPTEFDPDYLEMLRMSKYRILNVPDVQPGKCANCGSSKPDGRSYVDFGLDVAWYGTVFICSLCLLDIARNAKLFEEVENELSFANELLEERQALLDQGERLENTLKDSLEEVREYFDALHSVRNDSAAGRSSDVESGKESGKPKSERSNRPALKAEPGITKSTSGSGSENVLSIADLLKPT